MGAGAVMRALEARVPPPVVALLVAVAMGLVARAGSAVELPALLRIGIACGFGGVAAGLAVLGVRALRQAGTTFSPTDIERASALVTGGVYRYTRNPMYLGLLCLLAGWAVYLAVPWVALGPAVFVALLTRLQIMPEERVLAARFGDAFAAYRGRVRRWL